jgi:ketosteroid isomerase-like protein
LWRVIQELTMTRTVFIIPAVLLILIAAHGSARAQPGDPAVTADIKVLLNKYVLIVNAADAGSLRLLWADPEKISFISPGQRFTTWKELQGFFDGFLKNSFTERQLKPGNVTISSAGDAAWAVFDWEFNAKLKNGQPFQSRGWETHIYRRTDQGWRLTHIHYSVPITPPPGQAAP